MKAIQMRRPGPPEVLEYVDVATPEPGDTQVLVRAAAIGVGMPEILVRSGSYPWMPPLPATPGIEMAGTVAAVGRRVRSFKPGDEVLVSARESVHRGGCYAEFAVMEEAQLYRLPDGVALEAAATLANYQVAYHLLHSASAAAPGRRVVIIAAAGGVGSAALQLAKLAGMTVIAVVGSVAKAEFVRALGADHAIVRTTESVAERVGECTGGEGADLVLDPVGGTNFEANFDLVGRFGVVVLYGYLAGWPPPDIFTAMRKHYSKSPALRLFTMHSFDDQPALRAAATHKLLDWLAAGKFAPPIYDRIPLAETRRAHEVFESGKVMGKLLLVP